MSLQSAIAEYSTGNTCRINVENPDVLESIVWSGEKSKEPRTRLYEFDFEENESDGEGSSYIQLDQSTVPPKSFYKLNKRSKMAPPATPRNTAKRQRPPSTVPQAKKRLPVDGESFDFEKYVVEKLGEITSDKVVQRETISRLSEEMESNNRKLEQRMDALEKRLEQRPQQHRQLQQTHERKTLVDPKIARHVSHVYGSSASLEFNVEEGFKAPNNQIVRSCLLQELTSKWGDLTTDEECHVAIYNRYKNERQKYLSEKNGVCEELKEKRRKTALKHRKLNSRRKQCRDQPERDFWKLVNIDLMSDEESTDTLGIRNVIILPFRSEKMEESIKEMDRRRYKGKVVPIRAKVNRGVTKDSLRNDYSSDYIK